MRIIAAIDSFKGCVTSVEANAAIVVGAAGHDVQTVSVADGGEGTAAAICDALHGEMVRCRTVNALLQPIEAQYAVCGDTAIIDVASAIGLPLLKPEDRNPWLTSSYGVGVLVKDALERGLRRVLVALGGSSTNDAAMGLLIALGVRFIDCEGRELFGCGASLAKVARIDRSGLDERLADCELVVGYDVLAPAIGPNGCAAVFAPQKGADANMVDALEEGMLRFADVVGRHYFVEPGSGAAGGIGAGMVAIAGARAVRGVDMVLDACCFDDRINGASLIVTGEGRIDRQTLMGKTPMGVLERAQRYGVPVVALAGQVADRAELLKVGFADVLCINPPNADLDRVMLRDVATRNISAAIAHFLAHYC